MKTKYIPDLTKQLALCEANYARLIKLLPDIDECEQRDFIVDMAAHQFLVSICVQERFKYTSTLSISQHPVVLASETSRLDSNIQHLISPVLQIRLYHDARMAEVVSSSHGASFKGKYAYPNKAMYQVDEKIQLNDYLAQWLSYCLARGYQSKQIFCEKIPEHE
jgi:uncharacterized protein YqiB (DUF1249 family)